MTAKTPAPTTIRSSFAAARKTAGHPSMGAAAFTAARGNPGFGPYNNPVFDEPAFDTPAPMSFFQRILAAWRNRPVFTLDLSEQDPDAELDLRYLNEMTDRFQQNIDELTGIRLGPMNPDID